MSDDNEFAAALGLAFLAVVTVGTLMAALIITHSK